MLFVSRRSSIKTVLTVLEDDLIMLAAQVFTIPSFFYISPHIAYSSVTNANYLLIGHRPTLIVQVSARPVCSGMGTFGISYPCRDADKRDPAASGKCTCLNSASAIGLQRLN
jgi:hypothetical protein